MNRSPPSRGWRRTRLRRRTQTTGRPCSRRVSSSSAEAGDGQHALGCGSGAVRVQLADHAEEDERLLEVQLLDGRRHGPADGHPGRGQPQQDVVIAGAQGVAGRHDGQRRAAGTPVP